MLAQPSTMIWQRSLRPGRKQKDEAVQKELSKGVAEAIAAEMANPSAAWGYIARSYLRATGGSVDFKDQLNLITQLLSDGKLAPNLTTRASSF